VGLDSPVTLRELWTEIDDLSWKIYSGLDEELLETMEAVQVIRIAEESLRFEELTLLFLTPEMDRIEATLQRLGATTKRRLAARYEDFDSFFETLLEFKEATGIVNTATAMGAMIEIVEQWLADQAAAEADLEATN
jgi:hypothetical protein